MDPDDFDFDKAMERYDLAELRRHLGVMEARDGDEYDDDQLFSEYLMPLHPARKCENVDVSERWRDAL